MDTPEQAEIRRAALQALETIGARKLARQVGASPTGIAQSLRGEHVQPKTWTKLRAWYAREVEGKEDPTGAAGAVLLDSLLLQVAPQLRGQVRAAFLEDVGRIYGEAQMPAPPWLTAPSE